MKALNQTARVSCDTIPHLGVSVWQASDKELADFENGKHGDWIIEVFGQDVRDVRDGARWINTIRKHLYRWKGNGKGQTKKQLAKAVRTVLIDHFTHEIDEGLWIDGERVFDPHKDD